MRIPLLLLFLLYTLEIFAQNYISANKEIIGSIKIGIDELSVSYLNFEDGLHGPEGPIIDFEGKINFISSINRDIILFYNNNKWYIKLTYDYMINATSNQMIFISQQGYINIGNEFFLPIRNGENNFFYPDLTTKLPISHEQISYPISGGALMESISPSFIYSTEYIGPSNQVVRNLQETKAWLPTQPGGFSIGEDGLLYRNGMLWSVIKSESPADKYLGKIMSGHNLWADGPGSRMDSVGYFTITNPQGKAEIIMEVPWGNKNMMDPVSKFRLYNYGVGPWGEIYCLIAPPWKAGANYYQPEPGIPAELVVIRNHLKYFGRLNDKDVRLRKQPDTQSEILGTYPEKTGFRILETGTRQETIGGQKNVWYRVRLLDGSEGWFFGAFVHNLYDGPDGQPPPWPNVPDW